MQAGGETLHEETHVAPCGGHCLRLLKSAVIYGANASGKSNLFRVLEEVRDFVRYSATLTTEGVHAPFLLDEVSRTVPGECELVFLAGGVRYRYGLAVLGNRVVGEWLFADKGAGEKMWFSRRLDLGTGRETYSFAPLLAGQKKVWQQATRTSALFLSTAVLLNSEQLKPVYDWIAAKLTVLGLNRNPNYFDSIRLLGRPENRRRILRFVAAADSSICDIATEGEGRAHPGGDISMPSFLHETSDGGTAQFEFLSESAGTQRLFAYSASVLRALEEGAALVIDELDASFHALMVRFLVEMFNSREGNRNGAQLIFNTHDTSLLTTDVFRRDQIWFVRKDECNATVLYPLTDFAPQEGEPLAQGYLAGRYGAVPTFKRNQST